MPVSLHLCTAIYRHVFNVPFKITRYFIVVVVVVVVVVVAAVIVVVRRCHLPFIRNQCEVTCHVDVVVMGKRYFHAQNYRRLKAECIRRKQLFVDVQFPPTNDSLFLKPVNPEIDIIWKRPGVSTFLQSGTSLFNHSYFCSNFSS